MYHRMRRSSRPSRARSRYGFAMQIPTRHARFGQRDKKQGSRCNKRPANPEAKVVNPVADGARVAAGGAEVVWREVPGTAAVDTDFAVAAFDPGRTIHRRAIVIVVDAIFDPLKDVADHVIEAECIGLE